jgi:hypothetical protein
MSSSAIVTICSECNARLNPKGESVSYFDPRKVGPEVFCRACRNRMNQVLDKWLSTNPAEDDEITVAMVCNPTFTQSNTIN